MVRPSFSSTTKVSLVTVTASARGTSRSTPEVFIPSLHELHVMIPDDFVDSTEFCSIKATASLQPDRIEPELGDLVLTLDVNVLRFIAIAGVKEQSIRAYPEYCRHLFFVSNCSLASLLNLLRASLLQSPMVIHHSGRCQPQGCITNPAAYPAISLQPTSVDPLSSESIGWAVAQPASVRDLCHRKDS